jgi:effector-binding domain-containing protein
MEESEMPYDVVTHELGTQPILSIRKHCPQADIPAFIGRCFGDLYGRLGMLGVEPAGPPFVIYHEFGPDAIDAEVCVPVGESVAAAAPIVARTLPAMTVARTLHVGPYDQLGDAYAALTDWMARTDHVADGPMFERYLNSPDEVASPAEYRTEIEVPIGPAAVPVPG